jgi:hypothetical protein
MKLTRMYTGENQKSCFDDFDIPLMSSTIGSVSEYLPVAHMRFRRRDISMPIGYLNAPERQFAVVLAGAVEVEVGEGERRRFSPGSIIFAEDLEGEGHIARVEEYVEQIYIAVPDEFDLPAWVEQISASKGSV